MTFGCARAAKARCQAPARCRPWPPSPVVRAPMRAHGHGHRQVECGHAFAHALCTVQPKSNHNFIAIGLTRHTRSKSGLGLAPHPHAQLQRIHVRPALLHPVGRRAAPEPGVARDAAEVRGVAVRALGLLEQPRARQQVGPELVLARVRQGLPRQRAPARHAPCTTRWLQLRGARTGSSTTAAAPTCTLLHGPKHPDLTTLGTGAAQPLIAQAEGPTSFTGVG